MAGSGADLPSAFFPAWVLVWPVGTGDEATWTVDLLFTLSFLAIMFIFMQHKSITALTHVAPHRVDTFVLTSTIILRAFVFV